MGAASQGAGLQGKLRHDAQHVPRPQRQPAEQGSQPPTLLASSPSSSIARS